MDSLSRRKTTAVGADGVRPTAYQIRSGHFVVPRAFYESNKAALAWKSSFDVVAFGRLYRDKKIDDDRRLNIRLRDTIEPGDLLRLRISDDSLRVERG